MENRTRRIVRRLLLISTLGSTGCATSQIVAFGPTDPQLVQKLRLSAQEWQEIQSEFRKHRGDLKVVKWVRSFVTGIVEAYCVDPESPSRGGPVYFFRLDDGHWHMLREVSVWYKD
jgi:hypothetical protein